MTSKDLDQLEPEKTKPEGPTEAAQDLPYLLMLEDYLAEITFGVTKEVTASSQEPDQTSRRSRTTYRRLTGSYKGVTKELPREITTYHHLPYLADSTIFSPSTSLNYFLPYSPSLPHSLITPSFIHPSLLLSIYTSPYLLHETTLFISHHQRSQYLSHISLSIIITSSSIHLITLSPTAIILAPLSPLSLFHHITINSTKSSTSWYFSNGSSPFNASRICSQGSSLPTATF